MSRSKPENRELPENHLATLASMKAGIWYCFGDFAGCVEIFRETSSVSGHALANLAKQGYVESVPVFDGFMTLKHRITSKGSAWLKAQ